MYECLIKKYNEDGSTSYEYYTNEYDAIPKRPHIKIPDGAEYLICHAGCYNKELIFSKNNFEDVWSMTYNQTQWINSDWDGNVSDRLEYMKEHYGSIVLWKREQEMKDKYPDDVIAVTEWGVVLYWYNDGKVSCNDDPMRYYPEKAKTYESYIIESNGKGKIIYKRDDEQMNEDTYLLTKLQACDVLLSQTSVLQYQSTDGSWVDFKPSANKSNAHLYTILFNLDDTKFRIKPEWEHIPIEFCEVMDMLTDDRGNEVFINKEANLAQAENPLFYLQYHYHDKYSRVVEKQLTYDQWKNSVDLKTSLK